MCGHSSAGGHIGIGYMSTWVHGYIDHAWAQRYILSCFFVVVAVVVFFYIVCNVHVSEH